MVDCMCVWLYSTLGCEQLSKATVLLGCMSTLHVYTPAIYSCTLLFCEDLNCKYNCICPLHNNSSYVVSVSVCGGRCFHSPSRYSVTKEDSGSQAQFSVALQWRHWSAHDLAMILAAAIQLPAPETAPHFTLAFQYFDQVQNTLRTPLSSSLSLSF